MGNKNAGRPAGGQGRKDDEPVVDTPPPARPDTGNAILDSVLRDMVRLNGQVERAIAAAGASQSSADIANRGVVRLTDAITKLSEAMGVQSEGIAQLREELKRKRAPKVEVVDEGDDEDAEAPDWYSVETERQAQVMLNALIDWVGRVYLRGPKDAVLTYCWMWHPEVVDELVALRWAYFDAHHGENANGFKASDWRDRYRKSAIERINTALAQCSLAQHDPGEDKAWVPMRVPGLDDVNPAAQVVAISEWWATRRETMPPAASPNLKAIEKAARARPAD